MIKTKEDLKEWLSLEIPYSGLKNKIFPQPQMTFIRMLRRFEYHYNNRHSIFHKFMLIYYYYRYYKAGLGGGNFDTQEHVWKRIDFISFW